MKHSVKQILPIFFLFLFVLFFQLPFPAHALELQYPHIPGFGETNDTLNTLFNAGKLNLGQLVQFVFATSLWIAGLMAFGALLIAGFVYATSQGAPMKRVFAKNRIQGVAIGVGILLGLYIILGLVNPQLLTLGGSSFSICDQVICSDPKFPEVDKKASAPVGPNTLCRGTRTTTFQEAYGEPVDIVAGLICSGNGGITPPESQINTLLIDIVDVDKCTQQDVRDIKDSLSRPPSVCAGGTPGGVVGVITIDEHTKPAAFCEFNGLTNTTSGVALVGGAGWPGVQAITVQVGNFHITDPVIALVRSNVSAVVQDCTSDSSPNPCKLRDQANTLITSLSADQKEALVQVCTNVLRGAASP